MKYKQDSRKEYFSLTLVILGNSVEVHNTQLESFTTLCETRSSVSGLLLLHSPYILENFFLSHTSIISCSFLLISQISRQDKTGSFVVAL